MKVLPGRRRAWTPGRVASEDGISRSEKHSSLGKPGRIGYLYILPALIPYLAIIVVPMTQGAWLSFFDWDGVGEATWVGLDNYREVLGDSELRGAFGHAIVLILFYGLLPMCLGLTAAAVMSRGRVRGMTWFRAILFLPQVIAPAVVALVWRRIYSPDGPLNEGLRAIGLDGFARGWLGDFTTALPSLGLVGTWTMFGLCMVLFLAGIQNIPSELYDAAKVDGANAVHEFFAITLPGLRTQVAVVLTLTTITALKTFDLIYLTTRGGPGSSTDVPSLALYERAFLTGEVGLASSIAVLLTVLVGTFAYLIIRSVDARAAE